MTVTINLSLPAEFLKMIDRQAKSERRTRSEFLREAARERLMRDQKWKELQRYGAAQAKKMGIKTEEDVYQLIQEFRREERAKKSKH